MSAAEVEAVARQVVQELGAELNALTGPLYEPALESDPGGHLGGASVARWPRSTTS